MKEEYFDKFKFFDVLSLFFVVGFCGYKQRSKKRFFRGFFGMCLEIANR